MRTKADSSWSSRGPILDAAERAQVVRLWLVVCFGFVVLGLWVAAEARYGTQMGGHISGDSDEGPTVQAGLIVAAAGLLGVAACGFVTRRTARLFRRSLAVLGGAVLVAAGWGLLHGPHDRCAVNSYSETTHCITGAGAIARDAAVLAVPAVATFVVFWAVPRRPRRQAAASAPTASSSR